MFVSQQTEHLVSTEEMKNEPELQRADSLQEVAVKKLDFERAKRKNVKFADAKPTAKKPAKTETEKVFTAEPGKMVTRKNLPKAADDFRHDEVNTLLETLEQFKAKTQKVQEDVRAEYAIEDPKVLEVIIEHILLNWDEICACLVDELIEEEVVELNRIEDARLHRNTQPQNSRKHGKFEDYKSVDLRDITRIFDDYDKAERQARLFADD